MLHSASSWNLILMGIIMHISWEFVRLPSMYLLLSSAAQLPARSQPIWPFLVALCPHAGSARWISYQAVTIAQGSAANGFTRFMPNTEIIPSIQRAVYVRGPCRAHLETSLILVLCLLMCHLLLHTTFTTPYMASRSQLLRFSKCKLTTQVLKVGMFYGVWRQTVLQTALFFY